MTITNVPSSTVTSVDDSVSSDTTFNSPGTEIIAVDSSSGSLTVTLGDNLQIDNTLVKIVDVGGSAGTNTVTIDAGTSTINGSATALLDTNNEAAELVYLSAAGEWVVTNRYSGGSTLI